MRNYDEFLWFVVQKCLSLSNRKLDCSHSRYSGDFIISLTRVLCTQQTLRFPTLCQWLCLQWLLCKHLLQIQINEPHSHATTYSTDTHFFSSKFEVRKKCDNALSHSYASRDKLERKTALNGRMCVSSIGDETKNQNSYVRIHALLVYFWWIHTQNHGEATATTTTHSENATTWKKSIYVFLANAPVALLNIKIFLLTWPKTVLCRIFRCLPLWAKNNIG